MIARVAARAIWVRLISLASLFLIAWSLSPTVGTANAADSASGRTLVIAESTDVSNLDPQGTSQRVNFTAYDLFADRLTARDPNRNLIPQLATEWKLIQPTVWQFKLRRGVTFSNGEAFNAETVKYSIERLFDPKEPTANRALFTSIKEVKIVDPYTVNFISEKPDLLMPYRLAGYSGGMVPPKYLKEVGAKEFSRNPIGTGPYKLVEWKKDDRLVFELNPNYWGPKPPYARVIQRAIPEPAARIAALLAGEVDIAVNVTPDQAEQIKQSGKARIEATPIAGFISIIANVAAPPLNDRRIRQAMDLAIDRDALIKQLMLGYAAPANGAIVATDFAYDPSRPPLPYNLEKAKTLVREAGYTGTPIFLQATDGHILRSKEIAEALAAMWAKAGLKVQVEIIELSVGDSFNRHTVDPKGLYLSNPSSPLFDPDGHMWRNMQPGGIHNFNWKNEEWFKLMTEAKYMTNADERAKTYRKAIYEVMADDAPTFILFQAVNIYGVGPKVDWKGRADLRLYPWDMKPKP